MSLLVKMTWMTEQILTARLQISFLEENKRETSTVVHKVCDARVESNVEAKLDKEKLNLQFMTGSNGQTDHYQLYEINHYRHNHKSNGYNLDIDIQEEHGRYQKQPHHNSEMTSCMLLTTHSLYLNLPHKTRPRLIFQLLHKAHCMISSTPAKEKEGGDTNDIQHAYSTDRRVCDRKINCCWKKNSERRQLRKM